MRPLRAAAGALALGVALSTAACSDEGSDPPTLDPSASEESAPTDGSTADGGSGATDDASDADSSADVGPPPKKGDKVEQTDVAISSGDLPEGGPEGKAAQALVKYMELRAQSLNQVAVSPALRGIATGDALADVEVRVSELAKAELRTVGNTVVNVAEVDVDGETADIDACFDNDSVDVDRKGVAAETSPAAYDVSATAVKVAKRWYISDYQSDRADSC